MIKMSFSYTDKNGQETTIYKSFEDSVVQFEHEIIVLTNVFKDFLLCCGYTSDTVDKVKVED